MKLLLLSSALISFLLLGGQNEAVNYDPNPQGCPTELLEEFDGRFTNKELDIIYRLYDSEERELLYKCVQAENGSNTDRGIYLTACCILNRADVNWGGKTIKEVVYAKGQFAVARNGRLDKAKPTVRTITQCNEAILYHEPWVLAFSKGNLHSKWAEVVEIQKNEYFYRLK